MAEQMVHVKKACHRCSGSTCDVWCALPGFFCAAEVKSRLARITILINNNAMKLIVGWK